LKRTKERKLKVEGYKVEREDEKVGKLSDLPEYAAGVPAESYGEEVMKSCIFTDCGLPTVVKMDLEY